MQQPTRLISTPFAQEGEKTEIQNVTGEFDNSATYRLGFPPLTMQSIRLGGKPPKGTDFNGVLFDITENISFLCKGGRYQYNAGLSTLIGGYPEGSNLLLDDNVTEVVSTVAGNQNNPNINMTGWILKPNKTTAVNVADASGETQQQVNYNGGSKWHSRVGGYLENERVVLANGDIVKSTIDGNVNDPNVDMTGWVSTSDKAYVGLSNVDNTSDINKPVSTATNLAIVDATQDKVSDQELIAAVAPKADTTYVDAAVGAISTDASKQYATLALANADIANIALNKNVFISEAINGGYWYKATAEATSLTKSPYDPLTQAKADATEKATAAKDEAINYSESLAGNLRGLNDGSKYTDEFALSSVVDGQVDAENNAIHYIKGGVLHFQIPVSFEGTPSIDQFFKTLSNSYQLLTDDGEYALSRDAEYAIIDQNEDIGFSVFEHQSLLKNKEMQDKSYTLLNPDEYALSSARGDVQVDANMNITFSTDDYLKVLSFIENFKQSYNPYVPFINSSSTITIYNSDNSKEKIVDSFGIPSSPRQLLNDCVEWDINDTETPTYFAQAPNFEPHPVSPRKRFAIWGHSFTENPVMARTLATRTGLKVYNFGKSGLRSYGIAGRHNSPSIKYRPVGGSIPASGSINLETSSLYGLWCMFGYASSVVTDEQLKCSIAGVDGYIMWDGTNCTFTRSDAGSAVIVANYTDCIVKPYTTQSTDQVPANTLYEQHDECIQVLWLARNNISDTDLIISNYKSIIDSLKTKVKRFIIMPEFPTALETTGTDGAAQVALINSTIKSLYPENYCEIDGVDALQNFINHYNPEYAGDVEDKNNGIQPRTLRYDNLHPSQSKTVGANGASPYAEFALVIGAEVNGIMIENFSTIRGWI